MRMNGSGWELRSLSLFGLLLQFLALRSPVLYREFGTDGMEIVSKW